MPHEIVGQVVAEVAQGVSEAAVKEIHRKTGWKGCLSLTVALVAVGIGIYFWLR